MLQKIIVVLVAHSDQMTTVMHMTGRQDDTTAVILNSCPPVTKLLSLCLETCSSHLAVSGQQSRGGNQCQPGPGNTDTDRTS